MRIVFCIDDNPQFLRLVQVAVRSLRRVMGDAIPCLCVYAGDDAHILAGLAKDSIPVARYKPVLQKDIIPPQFHRCIGCFLKLELCLVPELLQEEYVLYCDADVLFRKDISWLLEQKPAYMAMAAEYTAPFFHEHESLDYTWRGNNYVVNLPFPIWTYSSGVVLFNAARLRKYDYIHNFLAFCTQNVHRIGNLDQSLLNYFFGKRISRLDGTWNRPPYQEDAAETAHIVHFHGPKPWDVAKPLWKDLRIHCYDALRESWLMYLDAEELQEVESWCAEDIQKHGITK